jgi:type 1 fimbria pilin
MKLNQIMIAVALTVGATSFAQAADQGRGKVTFTGSIIEAPCSIHPDSVDQTIPLGSISNVVLRDGGESKPRPFEIKLEQCDTSVQKTVQVTFTGDASVAQPNLLGITGDAKGASVGITDTASKPVVLGTATRAYNLTDGNNTLRFSAFLKGDGANDAIVAGDFTAVTDFTLAYQ